MSATWTTPKNWNVGELLIASDLNTHLRDNLEWLKDRTTAYAAIASTTTTSTSFVQVTGSSVNLTSVGGKIRMQFLGTWENTTLAIINYLDFAIDGTRVGDATVGLTREQQKVALYDNHIYMEWITPTPPSAAAHAYSLYWKVGANTGSIEGHIWAREL
jgi:hypothetical protein